MVLKGLLPGPSLILVGSKGPWGPRWTHPTQMLLLFQFWQNH